MKKLAFSSETYLIKASELKKLPSPGNMPAKIIPVPHQTENIVLLDTQKKDLLLAGARNIAAAEEQTFVPVRFAYWSHAPWLNFFINLIKPIKRRFYAIFPSVYTTTLSSLLQNNITRGERNEANAYQWNNKKWQISREEAHKRYTDLYNSIKTNGYDPKTPLLIMLNRKFGVKDQLLQGHHRIGICKSLNVREVSISFWAVPCSPGFMKIFVRRTKK